MTIKELGKHLLAPKCWVCSTEMVLRCNSRDGHLFWGCPCWPECKETEAIGSFDVPRTNPLCRYHR